MDREKVIRAVDSCFDYWLDQHRCLNPLELEHVRQYKAGALALLKEQDTPTRPAFNGRYWECEQCKERYKDILAVKEYKHCPGCGRRIEWQG